VKLVISLLAVLMRRSRWRDKAPVRRSSKYSCANEKKKFCGNLQKPFASLVQLMLP
jgi:hypothetical protein